MSLPFEEALPFEEELPFEAEAKKKGLFPEVGRAIDTGVRNIADIATTLPLLAGGGLASLVSQDAGDEIFRRMNTVQKMIHEGESTPESTLGKIGANAMPMVASMALGPAGIGTMMAGGIGRSGQHLVEQDVDPSTAAVASGIDVGTNLAGALVPGGILAQSGANVAAGGAGDYLVQQYLKSKGYDEVSKQYDPLDPVRRGTDLAVGAAFGVRSKLAAKPKDSKLSDIEVEQLRERAEQLRAKQTTVDNSSFYEQMPLDLQFKQNKTTPQDLINRTEQDIEPPQRDLFTPENLQRETINRNISQWEEPYAPGNKASFAKQQEIDAAWASREASGKPIETIFEPSQGGQVKFGFGKQSGKIDPDLLTYGVSRLIDYVRGKGIPEEKLIDKFKGTFSESALKTALDNSHDPKSRETLVWMAPKDFLELASKRKSYERDMQGRLADVKRGSIRMGLDTESGLADLPYLMVRNGPDEAAKVIGHEGRHRMDVFIEKGLDLIPVRVRHETARWGAQNLSYAKTIPQGEDISSSLPIKLDPIFKSEPLGQTAIAKGQRGSIGFKKQPAPEMSFSEFKRSLPEDLIDVADQLYKDKYGVDTLGKVEIASNNDVLKKVEKIPGLKGVLPVELVPKEEMLPYWKNEADIPMNVFRDQTVSGGRMASLMTNSSYVNWLVEKINRNIRDTEVVAKKATHDIVSASNKLKTLFGTKDEALVETMRELISKEGKEEALNLKSSTQKELADSFRTNWDNLYKAVNEERAARGIGPVQYRPNYLTAIFKGPYRGLVKDAEGGVVGVVAANTMKEAQLAVSEISKLASEKGVQVTVEQPVFSKAFAKDSFQKNIGAYYVQMNELMNLFGTESPAGKAFQEVATEWYDRRVRDHLGYRQHFKHKKGIIGSEGNKPWKDIRENSLDMLDAQIEGLQAGWQWVAQQRTAREIHDILNHPDTQHLKNATEYVSKYYDHAFSRDTKGLDPIRSIVDGIAKQSGLDPAPIYDVLGITRNFALVSTLGMSGGFVISQLAQVPQALISATTFLKEKGISASAFASFKEGLHDFYSAKDNNGIHSIEGKYAYDYFSKHGTFDPHLLEKQIPRKLISTAGSSGFKKAMIDGLINGPIWSIEQYNKHMGHISIEMAETATRGTFAMSLFHYLRRAGMKKEEAAPMADKLTSDFFVDYNPHERPMMWSSLGELGKFASTVTTFKMNALNQGATFANHKAYKTFAAATLALMGLAGVAGLPGFDEIEDIFSALKRYINPEVQTPKELLMKEAPDALTFGALAALTDTNLQTKFNQSNVLPDDISNFLFPLGRVLYNMGEAATAAISNPNKETLGRMAWEFAPGGAKSLPERAIFTEKDGISINPRAAGKGEYENSGIGIRSEGDWVKRTLGLTSLEEAKAKEVQFMMKRDKEITDKRLASSLNKAVQAVILEDEEAIIKNLQKYFSEGGTEESLKRRLTAAAIGRNTDIKSRMLSHIKGGTLRNAIEAGSLTEYVKE